MAKTRKVRVPAIATDEGLLLARLVVSVIEEKKGKEIIILNLSNIHHAVCDYFIVCHADSPTQVAAIAKSVEDEVHKAINEYPWHSEGFENSEWILLDYSNVVVHVFRTEQREFYDIERLWADAEIIKN